MIAKTLVLVCAAFGIAAGSCFDCQIPQQSCQTVSIPVATSCGSPCGSSGAVVLGDNGFSGNLLNGGFSGLSGVSSLGLASGVSSLGLGLAGVGATNGPETGPLPVVQAPAVTLPAVEGPTVALSSPAIPAPRVIAQRCICTKTIVKPQVFRRLVTVPKVQRYIKRTVTPVVENVAYKSTPIAQPQASSVVVGSSSGVGSLAGLSSGVGSLSGVSCGVPVVASSSQSVSLPVVSSGVLNTQCGSLPIVPSCPRTC